MRPVPTITISQTPAADFPEDRTCCEILTTDTQPEQSLKIPASLGLIAGMPNGKPVVVERDTSGKSADHDSFAEWYAKEYRSLVRTLILAVGDPDVAAEAASEAFARALQRWDRVQEMASPMGWTYAVALNVARRLFRRRRLESIVLRREIVLAPVREDSIEIWDAVQRLPVRQRTAIALHYLSDLSQRDVAAAMGIAEGTVAAMLSQARQRLAIALSHSVGEEELGNGRD